MQNSWPMGFAQPVTNGKYHNRNAVSTDSEKKVGATRPTDVILYRLTFMRIKGLIKNKHRNA